MFHNRAFVKLMAAAFLSVVGLSWVSLMVSNSAVAMLSESTGSAARLMPDAVQSINAVTDTTVANFQAGAGSCYVAPTDGNDIDGELILTPTTGVTFTGSALPAGWYSGTYAVDGNAAVGNGVITLAGAFAGTSGVYSPAQTLEFSATFGTGAIKEHAGLADSPDLNSGNWAIFSTGSTGDQLYARTTDNNNSSDVALGAAYLNSGHRYRIEWTDSSIIYSIDGTPFVTETSVQITNTLHPILSSVVPTNNLVVDWLRMSPFAATCSFQSRVLDAGQSVHWLTANIVRQQPAGTIFDAFRTRSGQVITPDGTWSAWTPLSGSTIVNPNGRYIQYQAQLTTTNPMFAPALQSVALTFSPTAQTITFNPLPGKTYGDPPFTVVATATSNLPVTFTVSGKCSNVAALVTLTGAGSCAVTAHQAGDATFDPAPNVTQSFNIAKANATITVTAYSVIYDGNAHTATGAATGVKGESLLSGLNLISTTHTNAGDYPSDPWTFTDSTGNYLNTSGTVHNSIAKANQTITFAPLADTAFGTPPFTVTASASSNLIVTFTASGDCTVTGNTVTLVNVGSCTVTAHQSGDGNHNGAPDVPRSFNITGFKLFLPLVAKNFQ